MVSNHLPVVREALNCEIEEIERFGDVVDFVELRACMCHVLGVAD